MTVGPTCSATCARRHAWNEGDVNESVTKVLQREGTEGGTAMGLFGRKRRGNLPTDIVAMMERFGRHEIDAMASDNVGYEVFRQLRNRC